MIELEKEDENTVEIDFHVNGMPLQQFKRFKSFAKNYRDNYSMAIQVLMDRNDNLQFMKSKHYFDLEQEMQSASNEEHEEQDKEQEVQTLGD